MKIPRHVAKGPRPLPLPQVGPLLRPHYLRPMVKIDSGWKSLPGWPKRCPGAGRVGRAWRAVDAMDKALQAAWLAAGDPEQAGHAVNVTPYAEDNDLLALADHPATGAAVREAILTTVQASKRAHEALRREHGVLWPWP